VVIVGFWTGSSLIVNPTITTVYTVTGMASNNCTNTAIAMVSVSKISSASSASAICKGQTATLTASGGGTYTWQPGTSGGGSSIVVSPSVTTVYTVTGVANNCTNTSVSTITVTLKNCTIGIEEQGMEDIFFSVFPNPTKGKFHLKTTEAAALKIINNLGQIVYESKIRQEEYVIDLSAEPAGIYFVQIQSKRLKTVKLVKE